MAELGRVSTISAMDGRQVTRGGSSTNANLLCDSAVRPQVRQEVRRHLQAGLEDAGLDPYRVDKDPSTEGIVDAIEAGIRNATICLADITTDNPNVRYELGYAFAVERPMIMVCSTERNGRLPFDIQHRTVIEYAPHSGRDFDELRSTITERAKALVEKGVARRTPATPADWLQNAGRKHAGHAQRVPPIDIPRQVEIHVLAQLVAETGLPGTSVGVWFLRDRVRKRRGLTEVDTSLALNGLQRKGFLEFGTNEEETPIITISDIAWEWIDSNDSLIRGEIAQLTEDDLPF